MKRKKIFAILFSGVLCATLQADDDLRIYRARTGYPYFDTGGDIMLLYRAPEGGLVQSGPKRNTDSRQQDINGFESKVESLQVKSDGMGRLWAVWETLGPDQNRNHIHIGRLTRGGPKDAALLSDQLPGWNYSPDISIGVDQEPWVAWVHKFRGLYSIFLFHPRHQRIKVYQAYAGTVLSSPRVLADQWGGIWLFWAEAGGRGERITAAFFNGYQLDSPIPIAPDSTYPQIQPAAALDPYGNPWVAWSEYDGNDYEIWTTSRASGGWSSPERVTRNQASADAEPSLVFYRETVPMLSWTQSDAGRRDIYLSLRDDSGWSSPYNLSRMGGRGGSPVLISQGNRSAVLWRDEEQLYLKSFQPETLSPAPAGKTAADPSMRIRSRLLSSRFTAFGDSITYGWDNGPTPENGYVPRLQTLLRDLYNQPRVINHGVPGEPTWEAVSRISDVILQDLSLYLLLKEGTNDVSTTSYSLETTAFNLREMMRKCRQYGVFPLLATIIPRAGHRWTATAQERTWDLNTRITALAAEERIMLADLYKEFDEYPESLGGTRALIAAYPDNLHPNGQGYQVIADTWYGLIRQIPFPPVEITALKKERVGEIQLNWAADPKTASQSGIGRFRVHRKQSGEKDYRVIATVAGSLFAYQDTQVSFSEDYIYALSSENTEGVTGPLSEPVFPVRGEPFPPQDIQVSTHLNKAFLYSETINRISWSSNSQNQGQFIVTGYRVYRRNRGDSDSAFLLITETSADVFELLDRYLPDLNTAQNYQYGISAVDQDGNESPIQTGSLNE